MYFERIPLINCLPFSLMLFWLHLLNMLERYNDNNSNHNDIDSNNNNHIEKKIKYKFLGNFRCCQICGISLAFQVM